MQGGMHRAWKALSFRSDFRLSMWKADTREARSWLIAAAIVNVVAQLVVATPGAWISNSILGLLTVVCFWCLPSRLGAGLGPLLVVQAVGSVVVIVIGHLLHLPFVFIEALAWIWALYCTAAMAKLGLNYFQTPKTQMP